MPHKTPLYYIALSFHWDILDISRELQACDYGRVLIQTFPHAMIMENTKIQDVIADAIERLARLRSTSERWPSMTDYQCKTYFVARAAPRFAMTAKCTHRLDAICTADIEERCFCVTCRPSHAYSMGDIAPSIIHCAPRHRRDDIDARGRVARIYEGNGNRQWRAEIISSEHHRL